MTRRVFEPVFDGKAGRLLTFFDDLVIGRKDIGPVAGDDAVDLLVYLVLVE